MSGYIEHFKGTLVLAPDDTIIISTGLADSQTIKPKIKEAADKGCELLVFEVPVSEFPFLKGTHETDVELVEHVDEFIQDFLRKRNDRNA